MEKIILIISGGVASLVEKPDNIELEIRDYDVEDHWDPDNESCKIDDDGDRYQEIVYPSEDMDSVSVKLDPIEPDEPVKFHNFYKCEDCNTEWEDEWSCTCDDECPVCGIPYSPYKSEIIE